MRVMADYSVIFPDNEGIVSEQIPDINLLMDSILTSMSELARENLLDPHDCDGKLAYISLVCL